MWSPLSELLVEIPLVGISELCAVFFLLNTTAQLGPDIVFVLGYQCVGVSIRVHKTLLPALTCHFFLLSYWYSPALSMGIISD